MRVNQFPMFTQAETIVYTGSAAETAITLNRGLNWSIQRVEVYAPQAGAGSLIQLLRKSSATTSNERTDSHADSKGVLMEEFYLDAGGESKRDLVMNFSDMGSTPLRIFASLGSQTMTVYVNITYSYSGTI